MNKKSSKLLAAVAVFAMVACAFCVIAPVSDIDGAVDWSAVEKKNLTTANAVTVEYSDGTSTTEMSLEDALKANYTTNKMKKWTISAGIYDVSKVGSTAHEDVVGSAFIIKTDGIEIVGQGNVLIWNNVSNGAYESVTNDNVTCQSTISIAASGVTLKNITVMPTISYAGTDDFPFYTNKAIYVTSQVCDIKTFSVEDVNIVPVDESVVELTFPTTEYRGGQIAHTAEDWKYKTYGGTFAIAKYNSSEYTITGVSMKNVEIQNGSINEYHQESATITAENVLVNITDDDWDAFETDVLNAEVTGDLGVVINNNIIIGNLDISGVSVEMAAGSSLTIETELKAKGIVPAEGVTTNSVQVIVNGKLVTDKLEVPTIAVDGDSVVDSDGNPIKNDMITNKGDLFEFGDRLNTDYTVTTTEYLSSDLVIPAGKTLTIASTGNLIMDGHDIVLQGTIVVEYGGIITEMNNSINAIVLLKGGVIANEGVIGGGVGITVTAEKNRASVPADLDGNYTGSGSVLLQNVTGAEFALKNVTEGAAVTYQLTVTGDIQAAEGVCGVGFDGVQIVGDVTVGQDVVLDIVDADLKSKATLTVDGSLVTNDALEMEVNSTIVMNGTLTGKIVAQTGVFEAKGQWTSDEGTTAFSADVTTANSYINGYTLTVKITEKTEDDGDITATQALYLSGDLVFGTTATTTPESYDGEIAFSTTASDALVGFIAEGVTVTVPAGMGVSGIVVFGDVVKTVASTGGDANIVPEYGTSYNVKVTSPASNTQYITSFAKAFAQIDVADGKKISVYGEFAPTEGFTVKEKQVVAIVDEMGIDTKVEVIVLKAGTITGTIASIEGCLTVYNGGKIPALADGTYNVKSTGSDEIGKYTRYAGLQYALDNAKAGDNIEVVGPVNVTEGDLTVKAGVTVTASDKISIAEGDLVIEEGAKLVLKETAGIEMSGDKAKIDVKGALDMTDTVGSITHSGIGTEKVTLTSTGTTNLGAKDISTFSEVDFNGVAYRSDDAENVITNADAAVTAVAAQDANQKITFYGTVSTGEIAGVKEVLFNDGAKVTVKSLTLADGQELKITGTGTEFTGKVIVKTGVAGSETDSAVDLSKVNGVTVTAGKTVAGDKTTTYNMTVAGVTNGTYAGSIIVAQGTVTAGTIVIDGKDVLNVAQGATLVVPAGVTVTASTASNAKEGGFKVLGTIVVNGTVSGDGTMTVEGTMTVSKDDKKIGSANVNVDYLTVLGTLTVNDAEGYEGTMTVDGGALTVGAKPTKLGATAVVSGPIALGGSAGVLKVYAGADVSKAKINVDPATGESDANVMEFYINNSLYMTVYANYDANVSTVVLANEDFKIEGYVTTDLKTIGSWFTDAEMTSGNVATSATVINTKDGKLYSKVSADVVEDIYVSVGSGISLYIDGVKVGNSTDYVLSVGTHTISATVDPGYKGTVTTTFNGAAVSGSFVITADMASSTYTDKVVITASGDISIDTGSTGSSDGMSLTEILLIVLVVLIAIMAIVIAMRMMRS